MKALAPFLAAVLLAGCARFQPQPLSPANTATDLEGRSLTNAALKSFLESNLHRQFTDWPARSWDFQMLTLAAFYYHPSLDVARAEWRAVEAGTKTAAGRPNPTVGVTPGFDPSIPGNPTPWIVPVTFDLPIETAGKRGRRIDAAKQLSESARLNIATVAWHVRGNLHSSLIDFVAAQERKVLLQKQTATQDQILKLLEQQAEVGAIAAPELAPARVAMAKSRADLADVQRQLMEARVRLADAVGVPVVALENVSSSFDLARIPAGDSLTSAAARRTALLSRTDILSALADYAASQAVLRTEIARQYPDLHLGPGYIFNAGSAGDSQWELGLTVELPVLNQNQGPIAEAKANRATIAARFIALQASIISEIDRAFATYNASRENVAASESVVTAQRAQCEIITARLRAGEMERLDLERAKLELTAALLARLDAQIKLHQDMGALEAAVQRPIDDVTAPTRAILDSDQRISPSPKTEKINR